MKKILYTLCAFGLLMNGQLTAQVAGCDGERYVMETFTDFTKTTVKYGENFTADGTFQELLMDVYTPDGDDIDKRPVIIWAFPGAFISGQRTDMDSLCQQFVKRGYVAATIDYRLLPTPSIFNIPDSLDVLDEAVRAMGDMKAAVRYFRQDAATNDNFEIDPDYIFVAGGSSGAITALHTAYLDANDNIPDYLQTIIADNGGLEGSSGSAENLTYSSKVQGVVNLSGALHKLDWLDAGEAPLASYHGTDDEVVPYGYDFIGVEFSGLQFDFVTAYGSERLEQRATAEGVTNFLVAAPDAGHESAYTPEFGIYYNDFIVNGITFLQNILCTETVSTQDLENRSQEVQVYPNPASEFVTIDLGTINANYNVSILDQLGRTIKVFSQLNDQKLTLGKEHFGTGLFIVQLDFMDAGIERISKKLVFYD